jgi:hypothetical protein
MLTTCSFDAGLLCWMYRTLESFGEDGNARQQQISTQRIVSGKAVPKAAAPMVTALGRGNCLSVLSSSSGSMYK